MLNMATEQNSGTVPNIIDIQFGDLDKNTDNKKDDKRLLGNFRGEIQIKGRYDINKFMENILKNEDKPLMLCMQFKDPTRESKEARYIYLQTSYKMCPPVPKKDTAGFKSNKGNKSKTSMVVNPPSSENSQEDFTTNKKPKERNNINRKKEESNKMGSTRSTLCEQLQNLLFSYQKKQSTGQAKRLKTVPVKDDKGKTQPSGYERNIGDGKHVDPTKKQKPKLERTKETDRERKVQRNATLIGREIGDIELDGRRFGAIFFSDPDDDIRADKRLQKDKDDQLNSKYGKRKWVLDKGAEDLDKERWNIPNWIPADTLCRCNSYFPDGKCKCHEFLKKIGVKEIGPLYVPQSTPYSGTPIRHSDGAPLKSQASSRNHGSRQEVPTLNKDRKGNTYKQPGSQHTVSESDDQRQREGNKAKSQISFKSSGDNLDESMNRPSGDNKGSYKNTASQRGFKDDQKRQVKENKETNSNFCQCGYIPDKNRCKCIPMEYDHGKGPPGSDKGWGGEGKAGGRYTNRVLPCVSKGTAKVDGKNYTAELIIRDDDDTGSKKSATIQKKERAKEELPSSGKGDVKTKFRTGDKSQFQRNEKPSFDKEGNFVQPSKDDEQGREVVVVPGKEPVVKIPGDGNYPEELGEKPFYCGCTGLWIEYYPKDRDVSKSDTLETVQRKKRSAQMQEPPKPEQPPMEPPSGPPETGTDIIPGFSFKLESCTIKLDKNKNTIDSDCLIREQEIQRFKQSGYKNQPPTLIMNDPYSTPLRIYEVSASEGKRFISSQ